MRIPTILDAGDPPATLAHAMASYWRAEQVQSLTALSDGARSLTYAQLEARTARLAATLRMRGAAPGDVLAITMRRSLDAVLLLLASVRAGMCPCVLEPMLPAEEVGERLALVGARWLAFDGDHRTLAGALALPALDAFEFDALEAADMPGNVVTVEHAANGIAPGTRALLLFTSGSTGRPKAVELTQAALLNNALGVIAHSELGNADRLLHVMPIYHTNGVNNQLFAPLLAGACVVFAERFRAEDMPGLMARHRPSIITGVPTMYSRMLAQSFEAQALSNLRMARCGSAPITETLHRQVEQKLGCPLVVSYGLSEATCTSTMNPPAARRIGSVGTVLRGQRVRLREADGSLTDTPGREGEICIGGPSLMAGYLGAPDATSRAVVDGWLGTGDLGRFDGDGYLYVTGRIKDVIIRGGENLSPLLIESVIVSQTRVAACCVVGRADRDLGEVPVAFVVRGGEVSVDAAQVCDAVRRKLSRIYVPQEVFFVPALPETAVGKVDRKVLAARVAQGVAA
ncbi:class I adenylate-forming enzyme family protein [Pandoraea sp.]|uniref:class I adenylate-forming enzyme family protein n=1 Tax=Pandoraea sp. TaxID=1883445 RepID=UPI00120B1DF6|nr:class I adenylate-forming enzyme family protein [Pandoraea sp.]TAL53361.1 MAG: long-chain fatty acid--CoA ligase [Pandoraea sp.]TAM20451.1 MAG: long-chain fatty acid--CoA ligase [Pandoraea sp.]